MCLQLEEVLIVTICSPTAVPYIAAHVTLKGLPVLHNLLSVGLEDHFERGELPESEAALFRMY